MAKTIALTIEIDGLSDITKQVVGLEQEIQKLNTELKGTSVGSDEYIKLRNEIATTTEQLKNAKKEQKDFIKSAEATKQAEGSYYALNQELVDLKKSYKNLSAAERDSAKGQELKAKIQGLDKELKKIDGSIGQFQRNVGNYPKGIGKIIKGLEQVIPGFENFSQSLKNAEGGLNVFGKALIGGFLAFQGAKLIGQAMKSLDEFNQKIIETQNTVKTFSGAYGEDLDKLTGQTKALADTFSTDAKTISEAAGALSKKMGISFEQALGSIEKTLVEGRGDVNTYLEKVKEFPESFVAAGDAISENAQQTQKLLDANKELAISQVNISKKSIAFGNDLKVVTATVKNGLLVTFFKLLDAFTPIGTAFYNLGKAVYGFIAAIGGIFSTGGKAISVIDLFASAINLILSPLQFVISLVTGLIGVMTRLAPFLLAAGVAVGTFTLAMNLQKISLALTAAAQYLMNGAVAAYTVVTNIAKVAQLAFNAAVKANPIGLAITGLVAAGSAVAAYTYATSESTDASNANTAALTKEQQEIKAKAEAEQKALDDKMKAEQAAFEAQQKIDEANRKAAEAQAEAIRKAEEARKQLDLNRKKYAEDEIKETRARVALLADLQARFLDEQIKNIQDAKEREIAETNAGFQKQIDDLKKNYDSLVLAAEYREKELIEIFKEGSAEVLAFQKASAEQLIKIADEQAKIRIQIELQQKAALEKINAELRAEELEKAKEAAEALRQFRDDALNSEIEFIDSVASMRELKNEETLNKKLMQETDAIKREELIRLAGEQQIIDNIALIRNKLQAVDDQEAFLKSQADAGVEIKQEEYDAVLKARQELNTQLSSEELKQTQNLKTQSDKQLSIRVKQFEEIAKYAQQGLQIIDEIGSAISARAEAQVQEQIDRSTERQEQLSADLEGATGLRRRFIQQQIDAEIAAQEKFAKVQEEIQIKAAKRQKAIAIAQATINGALAVTNILATTPKADFGIASAILIGLAVATTAAQIATIAAQPLAEGGAVVPVGLPDSGGKVVGVQNIPQTSKGDNVLVAARVGETFLNRKQTEKLRPILSAHGIPGFASGGLLGAPNLSGITQSVAIRAFNERTNAMQGQILESKVYLVTDELNRDTANQERIKKKVTFV
jgi:hypothetical protein